MKIGFFSNFLNHHQVPISDELYKITQGEYWFVATEPMPESFKEFGYDEYESKPYLIKAYQSPEYFKIAEDLAIICDVIIIGANSLHFQVLRAKEKKLCFEYSERWLKKGLINLFSPRLLKSQFYYHTLFYNKPMYELCASAYLVNDLRKMLSYKGRCYKWGYFTAVNNINIHELIEAKRSHQVKIIWCSRFIHWKHPEMPIYLARALKEKDYNFTIDMYGSGLMVDSMKRLAKELDVLDVLFFRGNHPNRIILEAMRKSNIFLFTSDRNEGWGAVLNEAMSNGCAVVASHIIGSVPYLIKHNYNGLNFKSCDAESLYKNVATLIDNEAFREDLAKNAYYSMSSIWSPKNAAEKFIELSNYLLIGNKINFKEGPCSIATPCSEKYCY